MRTKKNISLLIVAIAIMIAGVSCKKGFLDRNPLKDPSSATFWTSDADVQAGLAGVYTRLQADFFGYQRVYYDGLSDNAYADPGNSFLPGLSVMTTGVINPGLSNGSALGLMYSTPYRIITSCNYFLDNVDKAPISDASKNAYKGEVRFIRALAYFDLAQNFGNVIIYDHFPATLESAKIAKSTKEQVFDFIEQDLNFAVANLPDVKYNGHAVKGSAQALLGRVLITEKKWSAAAQVLQSVNSTIFGLSPDYAALFKTSGQANTSVNKEVMFATQYLAPTIIHRALNGMDLELGNYALLQPYQDLVNEYEMANGKLITDPGSGYDPNNPYANRDPRLDLTIKLPGEVWKNPTTGATITPQNTSSTGYMMEKYVDLTRGPFAPSTTATQSDQDYIHLRYADVLLMYAEAKNEVSGPDASIYDALDQVRARVSMPAVDRSRYNSQASLRDFIRHERRVELALEGQRIFDLKRWNIAHVKLPTMKTPAGTPLVFDPKYYMLPFLQYELDNNPLLVQNPGY